MKKILRAWLRRNMFKDESSNYLASVETNGSINPEGIIDELQSEGMELKRETVVDIVTRYNRKAAELVVRGYNVNTGLVYMRPVVRGVFHDKIWDSESQPIRVALNESVELKHAIAQAKIEILGEQASPMQILSVIDKSSGKTDYTLNKGRNAELKGSFIKIAGDNPECGVTFKATNIHLEVKVPPQNIVINEPSRLLILIPETMQAGEYKLSITTQYSAGGNSMLKKPRTATFDEPIQIN